MSLQQFAKQRNLKIKQVRELCTEILGNIPENLTDENISAIDNALFNAANKALPQFQEDDQPAETSGELITATQETNLQDNSDASSNPVVRIVGESVLRQNLQLYLQNVKKHFLAQQFEIDSLHFQIEQGYYQKLSSYQQINQHESINRMNRNSQLLTKQGVEALKTDSNIPAEDVEILVDIGKLMDFFSIA
jgi:altronate dehydratase